MMSSTRFDLVANAIPGVEELTCIMQRNSRTALTADFGRSLNFSLIAIPPPAFSFSRFDGPECTRGCSLSFCAKPSHTLLFGRGKKELQYN